jgi:hypothetical protein
VIQFRGFTPVFPGGVVGVSAGLQAEQNEVQTPVGEADFLISKRYHAVSGAHRRFYSVSIGVF